MSNQHNQGYETPESSFNHANLPSQPVTVRTILASPFPFGAQAPGNQYSLDWTRMGEYRPHSASFYTSSIEKLEKTREEDPIFDDEDPLDTSLIDELMRPVPFAPPMLKGQEGLDWRKMQSFGKPDPKEFYLRAIERLKEMDKEDQPLRADPDHSRQASASASTTDPSGDVQMASPEADFNIDDFLIFEDNPQEETSSPGSESTMTQAKYTKRRKTEEELGLPAYGN